MDKITADIKNKNTACVYLFYGEDAYKRRVYKDLLKSALFSNEMNYSYFEGESTDWRGVYDSCAAVPFFAEKRLVIVENSGKFKTKPAGGSADEEILKIFADLPPSTCLAFFEEEAAKNRKIFKEAAKKGQVCECGHDSEQTVAAWLKKGFAQAEKKISSSDIYFMIERLGVDYERLKKEFDKIIAYTAGSDEVTRKDIIAVTGEDVEARIFEMLDACGRKDPSLMLEKYYGLLANEVHPLNILANLRSRFELMLQAGELCDKGLSETEAAKAAQKPLFMIRSSLKLLKNFSLKEVEDIIEQITAADKNIKDGDMDERTAVEILLIKICKG